MEVLVIEIGLIAALVGITIYYAIQTKKLVNETKIARRDDPQLKVHVHDPAEDEWLKDVSNITKSPPPASNYFRIKAILINPGLVPIVITRTEEILKDENGKVLASSDRFVLPSIGHTERRGLYVFCLPWVIASDDFSIWYKTYELDIDTDKRLRLTLTFDYEVGEKQKSETRQIELDVH